MPTYPRYGSIRVADNIDDQKSASAIANALTTSVTQEDLHEFVLSQIKRIIHGDNAGSWKDDFVGSSIRALEDIDAVLDTLTTQTKIRRIQLATDITIPSGQNYKVLSVAGSELPAGRNIAIGSTTIGLVAAQLSAGQIGTHRTTSVAGNPEKNTVGVRVAGTNQDLLDSQGRKVLGLLQAEDTAVDGAAPNDTVGGNRLQVSFVYRNPSTEAFVAVSVADVENQVLELLFPDRILASSLPEEAGLGDVPFVDAVPQTSVTLSNAYLGGNTVEVTVGDGAPTWNMSDDLAQFKVLRNGADFLTLQRNDGVNGDLFQVDTDRFFVNNSAAGELLNGVKFGTSGTAINVGVTAGRIDRATSLIVRALAGTLTLAADGATSDIALDADRDILLTDVRFTAVPFSDASPDGSAWDASLSSPPSIVAAINRAAQTSVPNRYGRKVHSGGAINSGTNVPGASFFDFTTQSGEPTIVF